MTALGTETATEAQQYDEFVRSTMLQVCAGLELDHTAKKRRIADVMKVHVTKEGSDKTAAQRVLEGRFALGADDSAYLQTGLATLWSTAPGGTKEGDHNGLALSPPGLYTPDAVDGIRAGLVRALRAKNRNRQRNAPADLSALVPAIRLLLQVPTLRKAVTADITKTNLNDLLGYEWSQSKPPSKEMRAQMLTVLEKLRKFLEGAKDKKSGGDNGQPTIASFLLTEVHKQAKALQKAEEGKAAVDVELKELEKSLEAALKLAQDALQAQVEALRNAEEAPNAKGAAGEDAATRTAELKKAQQAKSAVEAAQKTLNAAQQAKEGEQQEEYKAQLADLKTELDEVDRLKREDAARKEAERQQNAEATTREGTFLSNFMEHVFNDNWANDDDRLQKAKTLSKYFARLALVQMCNAAVKTYTIASFFSSIDRVAKRGKEREEADARANGTTPEGKAIDTLCEASTAEWLKDNTDGTNATGRDQYKLLCVNLTAWKLYQYDDTQKADLLVLPKTRHANTSASRYWIPLTASCAENLELQIKKSGQVLVMENVTSMLASWYSLPDTVPWGLKVHKRDGFPDLHYLYSEPADRESEKVQSWLVGTLMAAASGVAAGAGDAMPDLTKKARDYFGVAGLYTIGNSSTTTVVDKFNVLGHVFQTTVNTDSFDEQMTCERNGNGSLVAGLRAPGTGPASAFLALQCYTISTEDNIRSATLAQAARRPQSPATAYSFDYDELTDDLKKKVLKIGPEHDLVRLENKYRPGGANPKHDCVLFTVSRDALLPATIAVLRNIADLEPGTSLAKDLSRMVHAPLFMREMQRLTLTNYDDPEGTRSVPTDDECITALATGASIYPGVPERAHLIANLTAAHMLESQKAMQRASVRSSLQHVARGPFDNLPVALYYTQDLVVSNLVQTYPELGEYPVPIFTNALTDYLIVPFKNLLDATTGWAPDDIAPTQLPMTNNLVSPALQKLRDDPITGTLRVEQVRTVLKMASNTSDVISKTTLSDLPSDFWGVEIFQNLVVSKAQFAALTKVAADELLKLGNPQSNQSNQSNQNSPVNSSLQGGLKCYPGTFKFTDNESIANFAEGTKLARNLHERCERARGTVCEGMDQFHACEKGRKGKETCQYINSHPTRFRWVAAVSLRDRDNYAGMAFTHAISRLALLLSSPAAAPVVAGLLSGAMDRGHLFVSIPNFLHTHPYHQALGFGATNDQDFSHWVVARGLVGQRGPVSAVTKQPASDDDVKPVDREADTTIASADARLPYALPSPVAMGAIMPHLKLLLDGTDEPTEAEVHAALSEAATTPATSATAAEVLALFCGNYAVIGNGAAADAADARGGIEVPHAVRWLPTADAAGRGASRAAMLEHVAARCAQLAEGKDASEGVKAALREAAATLKLMQMEPLYAARESVAYGSPEKSGCCLPPPPPPSTTGQPTALVTKPCAVVRGTLAFPVDAGIARVDDALRISGSETMTDNSSAKNALKTHANSTLRVRAQARSEGKDTSIYVAPPLSALRFQRASVAPATGAPDGGSGYQEAELIEASERIDANDFTVETWLRIVNRAVLAAHSLRVESNAQQPSSTDRVDTLLTSMGDEGVGVTPESRRDGLWTEFQRHSAISQDRLWIFLRLLSGAVGGDVNEVITTADEATLRATKAIQQQRVAIAKRVSDMQANIVETIVGSMAKDSKLTFDKDGSNQLVVIDADARKQLGDLASGESGRPFFEANVAVRNLQKSDATTPKPTLAHILTNLTQVGTQMQQSLEASLTRSGTSSASLAELSNPANCYFVSLRSDAVAAIRIAHERMNVELGLRGAGRRLSLWEVVEGGCPMLTTRFAEFCGHILVQARSTTGISAMYVAPNALHTNAIQARVSLERLVHGAGAYTYAVSPPDWATLTSPNASLRDARGKVMDQGSQLEDHQIGLLIRQATRGPAVKSSLTTHRQHAGWGVVGLRTR